MAGPRDGSQDAGQDGAASRSRTALREADDARDEQLMRRVQDDDPAAFGTLYDRLAPRALRVVLTVARDGRRAEEILQEAFLAVWRNRQAYRAGRGTVAAWVLGIVRNRAIDSLRRNVRHDRRRADVEDIDHGVRSPEDLEERAEERDEAARLRGRIALLPVAQRQVVALAYFGELSASEIATELDLPLGTVKGRMRLALDRLRPQAAA